MWARLSRVRLRVISTRPSWVKPFTVMRVRSSASAFLNSEATASRLHFVVHVDEVEDDDPAQVAQPELARDHLRSFQVGLEYGVVEGAATDEPPVLTSMVVSASVWSMMR